MLFYLSYACKVRDSKLKENESMLCRVKIVKRNLLSEHEISILIIIVIVLYKPKRIFLNDYDDLITL